MLHRLLSLLCLMLFAVAGVFAQDGKISGTVFDENGEPVGYAPVAAFNGQLFIKGATTDESGKYSLSPIEAGVYTVKVKYLSNEKEITGVSVISGQTRFLDIRFEKTSVSQDTVQITSFKIPVFEKDAPSGSTIGYKDVRSQGTRNTQSLVAITAGVYQSDEGNSAISIRGARSNATAYYIDGQKIRGGVNLPQAAIAQLQVITGGTPAEFGDFTGGVVSITTAKPSAQTSGGIEVYTSKFLDPYNASLGAFSLSGPIITKKKTFSGTEIKVPVLGYFFAAEGEYNADRSPGVSNGGLMRLRDGLLEDLEQTPLQPSETGRTFLSRANYITADDMVPIKTKSDLEERYKVLARIDFQPTDNMLIKVGGNYEFSNQNPWGTGNMLFAPKGNGNFQSQTYRGWMRFQQSFKGSDNSLLRNLFYQIQADYSSYSRLNQNPNHGDRLFDYGYVGKFDYDRVPFYAYVNDPLDPLSSSPYWVTAGYGFKNLRFDPSNTKNPVFANYNTQIMNYVAQNGIINPFRNIVSPDLIINNLNSLQNLQFVQGILNGGGPPSIYGLFSGIGANAGGYSKFVFDQYRVTGQATAEIKGHNIKAGFEFEQRSERFFSVGARGLWGWMRLYANNHFANSLEDDPSTFDYVYRNGVFQDTINVPNLYNGQAQTSFDRNLRSRLGLPTSGTDYINIDALDPSIYSLDLFNANELLAGGLGPISYYGYDYLGQPMKRVDPALFFTDTVNRPMNAYAPTYISGFVQDKFEFEDIIFNVGFRVDRFDANQPVLRDPFSLYPTFTARETAALLGASLPGGVGNEWVAYVDDAVNPSQILGFRDGENWYDQNGAPVSSQRIALSSGGKPRPHVKENRVGINSFRDYPIQTVFMPRVSFSFPISDLAVFFAHYDVLAQRPGQLLPFQSSFLAGQLSDYAFLENRPTIDLNNPALRPEVTVDYETGFRQKIGDRSALSIQAFYREMRGMIRPRRFVNAYPFTYDAYDNLDYATVKGLTMSYDMRRTGNVQLRASYTLQYANSTSATGTASRNLASNLEGIGVLRVLGPDGIDQRHRIVGVLDYRYEGERLGPAIRLGDKVFHPLKNFGFNFTNTLGSGTPYTQAAFALPTLVGGTPQAAFIQGRLNGKRLPFNYRGDLRVDKGVAWGGKQRQDGTMSREFMANFYLQVLNAFNTRNILGVFGYTGLPDDDGYLTSDVGRDNILVQINPESFVDMYTVRMRSPFSFTRPRVIRFGLNFNF